MSDDFKVHPIGGGEPAWTVICTGCGFSHIYPGDRLGDAVCPTCGPLDVPKPKPANLSRGGIKRRGDEIRRHGHYVGAGFMTIRAAPRRTR